MKVGYHTLHDIPTIHLSTKGDLRHSLGLVMRAHERPIWAFHTASWSQYLPTEGSPISCNDAKCIAAQAVKRVPAESARVTISVSTESWHILCRRAALSLDSVLCLLMARVPEARDFFVFTR